MKFVLAALVALAVAAPAAAAQGTAMTVLPGPQMTPGAVSRITLYRTAPGKSDAFWTDVRTHLVPIYEEYKKRGLVTNYGWFGKVTLDNENDWDTGFFADYANWAALDNLTARNTDPVTLGHYGNAANRTAAGAARNQNRTVVSSFLTRSLAPNPVPAQ